jgi:hypothetical protein
LAFSKLHGQNIDGALGVRPSEIQAQVEALDG